MRSVAGDRIERIMTQQALSGSDGNEFWIQHAVERFRDVRGRYPTTLEAAVAGHPNALVALDRVGRNNVQYELDGTRGYLLTFLRPENGNGQPAVRIEDRHSYLAKLRTWQDAISPEPVSVLIVDDNRALCEGLARYLERKGCDVTTASDGVEGLEAVRSQPFDVVISDVNMPQRGGLWLYEQAVALRPQLRGRFVLCSSEPLPESRTMLLCRGSDYFRLKPFSLETIWRDVQEIIQRPGWRLAELRPRAAD